MSTFNQGFIQSGDGNVSEPVHVGRTGQQVIFSSVTPAESYLAKYPTIESVPADFNGTVDIVTPTYRATVKGDGTTKYTIGVGDVAYRPSAVDFGAGTWQDGANLYTSNGDNYKLQQGRFPTLKWDAAKAKASSGFGNAKLLFIGDSTTAGAFAFDGTSYAGAAAYGVPTRVAAEMAINGIPTSIGSSFGAHGLLSKAQLLGYDTRITLNTGWDIYTGQTSLGGDILSNITATLDTYSFAPVAAFDTIDIYYVRLSSGGGTFTVDIGAGVISTIDTTASPTGIAKATITVASGINTINLTKTATGLVMILGISCYKNNNEVQVINAGVAGLSANSVFSTVSSYSTKTAITAVSPDLTVINLGINDAAASIAVGTFSTKYQALIDWCIQYGDVVLAVPNPISGVTYSETIYAKIRNIADINSLNLIDYSTDMGIDWTIPNASGLMGDALHPKQAGYKAIESIAVKSGIFY
jgi:lysophospholipase L1-like esterase